MKLSILYEDNHLLIIDKPAGLATMGAPADTPSLLTEAKAYIKRKYQKPGNVYLGVVSRLDAPVTGAVVIARTSKAASRLSEQFRQGQVEKCYWAVTESPLEPPEGVCENWVRKDERHRKMHISHPDHPQAQQARLRYRTLRQEKIGTLVEVHLETGRKHQIRLQLSHHGAPILGDRKYKAQRAFSAGIALHSRRVALTHPVQKTPLVLEAPLPESWRRLGIGS